jgi:L-fucose mutarotase/ribose pyranase (RbsD/FucU family)
MEKQELLDNLQQISDQINGLNSTKAVCDAMAQGKSIEIFDKNTPADAEQKPSITLNGDIVVQIMSAISDLASRKKEDLLLLKERALLELEKANAGTSDVSSDTPKE